VIRGFGWWLCMHSHTDERRDLGRGHGNREGFGPVWRFWTLSSGCVVVCGVENAILLTGIHPTPDAG